VVGGWWLPALLAAGAVAGAIPAFAGAHPSSPAPPLAHVASAVARQHQQFLWDFSECFDYTISTGGTEFVDGARLDLPGGCFLRFAEPEASWLEATFVISGDPRASGAPPGTWRLTIFHLAPSPDGRTRGTSPVRVLLNGQEAWQGSPADQGEYGPGRVWAATEIEITRFLRPGRNTLRWDILPGAIAPYWLKVIHVGWEPD
jgi:hypothetical protein